VFGLIANLRTMTKLVIAFSSILIAGLIVNLLSLTSSNTQQTQPAGRNILIRFFALSTT